MNSPLWRVVVDTNVFVSALLSPSGKPATVLNLILSGKVSPVADALIFAEYFDVLLRVKFRFSREHLSSLAKGLRHFFEPVSPFPLPYSPFLPDPEDEKFLAVALGAGGIPIVTGNMKHFPQEIVSREVLPHSVRVMTPGEFLFLFFS